MPAALATTLLSLAALFPATTVQGGDPVMPPDKGTPQTTASGLTYCVLEEGSGPSPSPGMLVSVHYSGWLTDGKLFDSSVKRGTPFDFTLGAQQVISGWDEGVALMKKGARYKFTLPPALAYGERGSPPVIPPSSTLVFEVQLLDFTAMPSFRPANPEAQKRLDSGILFEVIEPGEGQSPTAGKVCEIEFALFNTGGKLLDCSAKQKKNIKEICGEAQFSFMNEVLPLMKPGARWRLEVPPALAFGPRALGRDLPAHSTTVWEIALVTFQDPLPLPEFKALDPQRTIKTESGLAYEVLRTGTGAKPKLGQKVTVHYAGWLTDGKLFDSSFKRSEPATFQLGAVIGGWNEGLQLMEEGAIYRFEIPPALGYGAAGSPPRIPANSVLIFHVELLRVGA